MMSWPAFARHEEAGLGVKLNGVVVRGYNDKDDVVDLARLTLAPGVAGALYRDDALWRNY